MNIVILGAGTVGASIARRLCAQHHDVCLVDNDREKLVAVDGRLDVQTVCGSASDAVVLFQAGAASADLCLALTNDDQVNLLGASIARRIGTRRSVARVFQPCYLETDTFDYAQQFQIDRLLSLEQLVALALARAIRMPGLFSVEHLARGGIEIQEVAVEEDAQAVGARIADLKLPPGVRIGVVSNGHDTKIAGADDTILAGNHVTFIGRRGEIDIVRQQFEHKPPPRQHVVIAGGGEIGFALARVLEGRRRFHVMLLESDLERSEFLSEQLTATTVLKADATRRSQMEEAHVGAADVFVAATGRDEDNIVCGVEARGMGCKRIMSVVRRPDYIDVLSRLGIDQPISPREVLGAEIQGLLQSGPIVSSRPINGGDVLLWEVIVDGTAPIASAPLRDIELPNSLVAAVVRGEHVIVPGADDRLKANDTAIVLVQKESADAVRAMFQSASGSGR